MIKKKKYTSPFATILNVELSPYALDVNTSPGSQIEPEEQLSKEENFGSWEDIWGAQ